MMRKMAVYRIVAALCGLIVIVTSQGVPMSANTYNSQQITNHHMRQGPMSANTFNSQPITDHHMQQGTMSANTYNSQPITDHHMQQGPMPANTYNNQPITDHHMQQGPMSANTYNSQPITNHHMQQGPMSANTYNSQPITDHHIPRGPGQPQVEVDVDTYTIKNGKNYGNWAQASGPKQIGYRYEYDAVEPEPTTTPAPFQYQYYPAANSAPQSHSYNANQAPQVNTAPAATPMAPPTYPGDQWATGYYESNYPQTYQSNVVNGQHSAQPASNYPPHYDPSSSQSNLAYQQPPNQSSVNSKLEELKQLIIIGRQKKNAMFGHQSYQTSPLYDTQPYQNVLTMLAAEDMHCYPLFIFYNPNGNKYEPTTCNLNFRCPVNYETPYQIGKICICCPNYVQPTVLSNKAYELGAQVMADVRRTEQSQTYG